MEILRRYAARHSSGFAAYLALQRALMGRFVARGGSAEEFCTRLAPAFRARWGPVLLEQPAESQRRGSGSSYMADGS